jgi:hypothetical protein
MTPYSFEMVDETDIAIEGSEDELVLLIREDTLQSDVNDFLVPVVSSKRISETLLTIHVQLESMNARKCTFLKEMLESVMVYFDSENILVVWFYEATDEKSYEMGLKIQQRTRINFSFQVY